MTFEELVIALETLAPSGVEKLYAGKANVLFKYVDGTKDSVEIEIATVEDPGDEIIVSGAKGNVWYFSPALCHWLGMTARLRLQRRGQEK